MKPTDELKNEHEAIRTMLAIMSEVCDKLDTGRAIEPGHLDEIVEFVQVFADKCHHAKEEGLLFPAMVEAGIPKEGGPIGVMLTEHDLGRAFIRNVKKATPDYKSGDKKAAKAISENARGYAALLDRHIDKEDNILYPMADAHLTASKQAELLKAFERVEREVVGAGKHEQFHAMLQRLQKIYLGD
ncbi:MAG: hemerythrin domain-containing protein [Candidatus Aminicenantes bacterium]|nr:hemerythrin domain-containing protein [Candidatus Aminicenantes bacterium]